MFRPADIVIDAFIKRLRQDYDEIYGRGPPGHWQALVQTARMTLPRIAQSNALYHTIDHSVLVTLVGQQILKGILVRDGEVPSKDWVNFVASCLCFAVGFVSGACPGDEGKSCVTDDEGGRLQLPRGSTDGMLWPYFPDRSKIFVRHHFKQHPILDAELMCKCIEYTRYPPPPDRNLETASYPGLVRAAHIIGAVADPDFMLKMKPLFLELQESQIAPAIGIASVVDLRVRYPTMFWETLHPKIIDGMKLLRYTGRGRAWLANIHAHMLAEEQRQTNGAATA